jgi:hypothetical protein
MDDVERRLAEQMADRLRALIKQFESLEGPAPEWVGVKLALIRNLLAYLESMCARGPAERRTSWPCSSFRHPRQINESQNHVLCAYEGDPGPEPFVEKLLKPGEKPHWLSSDRLAWESTQASNEEQYSGQHAVNAVDWDNR